jgi:hypothetical protein
MGINRTAAFLALLLLFGCSVEYPPDETVLPLAAGIGWKDPQPVRDGPSLDVPEEIRVSGDFLGSSREETAVLGRGKVRIYSSRGRLVSFFNLPDDGYLPVLVHDYDRDGKKDFYCGTSRAPRPEIAVYSGLGRRIGQVVLTGHQFDGSVFLPAAVSGDRLYAVSRESWPDRPRGIFSFRLPDMELLWFFHLPVLPVGVTIQKTPAGDDVLIVNHQTIATSLWRYLGKDQAFVENSDISLQLIALDQDGNLVDHGELTGESGEGFAGTAYFFPLEEAYGSGFRVLIRDETGGDRWFLSDPSAKPGEGVFPLIPGHDPFK